MTKPSRLPSPATVLPIEQRGPLRIASFPSSVALAGARLVLAVKADVADLANRFVEQSCAAPLDAIDVLVTTHNPGIPMRRLQAAPAELPHHDDVAYFELDADSFLLGLAAQNGALAIHVAGDFPGLDVQVWLIGAEERDPARTHESTAVAIPPGFVGGSPGPAPAPYVTPVPAPSMPPAAGASGGIVRRTLALLRPRRTRDAAARAQFDEVKLGAAAPGGVSPGQRFIAQFVAYPEHDEEQVRKLIKRHSPSIVPLLGKRTCRWAQGTNVEVRVQADGIEFDRASQSFTWDGAIALLDFSAQANRDAPGGDVVLTYDVAVAGFPLVTICLTIRVSAQAIAGNTVTATAPAARTAFASYASQDRALVTHMVGAIERAAGIHVFQDCLDLKAGDAWKARLDREIQARDVFMLFWSRWAAESTWVEWEWRTALRTKGRQAIQVHPLQPDVAPPSALRDLNFASVHAIVADYYAREHRGSLE
jgi:type VI secretion system (T6SS) EvfL/ImpJ/VasE family protein/TIR domain-containing protein